MVRYLSLNALDNPTAPKYEAHDINISVESLKIVTSSTRGYTVKILMQETYQKDMTSGGSTFYATVRYHYEITLFKRKKNIIKTF